MNNLPNELKLEILKYLDISSKIQYANSSFYNIYKHHKIVLLKENRKREIRDISGVLGIFCGELTMVLVQSKLILDNKKHIIDLSKKIF